LVKGARTADAQPVQPAQGGAAIGRGEAKSFVLSRRPLSDPSPLAAVMRNGQKLKTTFTPIARAFGTALLPAGLTRY
jgi:hypothetical protein